MVDEGIASGLGAAEAGAAESASAGAASGAAASDGESVPGPGKITAELISQDPQMVLYHDFVSKAEVEHLLALCEGRWSRSLVTSGKASSLYAASAADGGSDGAPLGQEIVGDTRTSNSVHLTFDESYVVERIAARVAHVAGATLAQVEPLVALRYEPGQYFKLHHDGAMRPTTVFVYLNALEPDSGGETCFPHLGFQVRPEARTALKWNNRRPDGAADTRLSHEAKPVLRGVKYGLNCFVNAQPQRETDHIVVRHLDSPA